MKIPQAEQEYIEDVLKKLRAPKRTVETSPSDGRALRRLIDEIRPAFLRELKKTKVKDESFKIKIPTKQEPIERRVKPIWQDGYS